MEDNYLFMISKCWVLLPVKLSHLKEIGVPISSAFGSIYKYELIFSYMKSILSKDRSKLSVENSDL